LSDLDDFKATYFDECSELLLDLEEQFAAIQSGDRSANRLNAVFRAIHSIKGGGGAFGFSELVAFAHDYETLLDHVRDGRVELSDTVSTLCIRATPAEVDARQVNKVVFGANGRALYFSKYGIPFDRDNRGAVRYKHVGLYAYTGAALDTFHRLPPSVLERTEGLEQLRFLEHGVPITVTETTEPTIGVDTEEDLRAAEARLTARR